MRRRASTETIERVGSIDRARFERDYVARNRPLLIANALASWPAMTEWQDEDYFRTTVGSQSVEVYRYPGGDFYDERTMTTETWRVGDYLDATSGRSACAGGRTSRSARTDENATANADAGAATGKLALMCELSSLPALVPSIRVPTLFDHRRLKNIRFHLRRDSVTVNHYHPVLESFLCQVAGEKRVVLYPPEDTPNLYAKPFYDFPHSASSEVNFGEPDFARFPKLLQTKPIELVLRPGEMLYIPVHWWHWVVGSGFVVSVAFFWYARLRDWQFPDPGLRVALGIPTEKLLYLFRRSRRARA